MGASTANKPKGLEKNDLGNEFPKSKDSKSNESNELGKAVVQAIESIAPGCWSIKSNLGFGISSSKPACGSERKLSL